MPTEVGIEVLCPLATPSEALIEIELGVSFFYRVFPTIQEQKSQFQSIVESDEDDEIPADTPEEPLLEEELRTVFKKSGPHKVSVKLTLSDVLAAGKNGVDILEAATLASNALSDFANDKEKFRPRRFASKTLAEKQTELRVPQKALENSDSYSGYLASNYSGKPHTPIWASGARVTAFPYDDSKVKLSVTLQNRAEEKAPRDDVDNAMFDTSVRIRPIGFALDEFRLDEIEEQHRFDNRVPALGINCVAIRNPEGKWIETIHCPANIQYRYEALSHKDADLSELSENPIPSLAKLIEDMGIYAASMKEPKNFSELTDIGRYYYQDEINRFEKELSRFSTGLRILQEIPEALEAFKLTNLSFARSIKGFTHWYRYQIVFLVALIPDLVATRHKEYDNYRDHVDVIYFPTGGGKTEAYLAAVVFQIFYDRLCGKKCGVSAITKFPLRLLSLQQIQRIADIFGAAEKIRRAHKVIGQPGYDAFSTGYYVGDKNTPNRLYKPKGIQGGEAVDEITPVIRGDPKCDGYKIITTCPFCSRPTVRLEGDLSSVRIKLVCSSCKEEIPVYVSDEEIYRYLPSFIVSTLDKMAISGWSQRFKNIYGQVTQRCPDHGFTSGGKCLYQGAGNLCKRLVTEYQSVSLEDPTPSILVQDEMHLVRESLGSYDAHYETFLDSLQMRLTDGSKRMKIIAATATISHFEDQIKHLYMRKGQLFPSRGRTAAESFYGREDKTAPARITFGILPHGRTMIHTVLDVIKTYYELTRMLEKDSSSIVDRGIASRDNVIRLLGTYRLILSYNLKKMQGDAVGFSVSTMVNDKLRQVGLEGINCEPLTGEVTFADIRRVLETIENPKTKSMLDLITATSMISHGVDIDTLNFVVFQGMPSSTAEYIQAQSRVGRKYPGIVFVVFDHNRERDASYYKYFVPYHNLRDLLIEPVPINRWAKFSINQTLPGVFSASVLNCFEALVQRQGWKRLYMTKDFKGAMDSGLVAEDQIVDFLLESYRVKEEDVGYHFEDYIRSTSKRYIGDLLTSNSNEFVPNALSDRPLSNLRDVDIQIEISRSAESFEPMNRLGSRHAGEE